MFAEFSDILSRIAEPPEWWDQNGVPRFGAFTPNNTPDIHAKEIVLFEIACQNCLRLFKVALAQSDSDRFDPFNHKKPFPRLSESIFCLEFGDPPRHEDDGKGEECGSGNSMNCLNIRVLEFWVRAPISSPDRWVRRSDLERPLEDFEDYQERLEYVNTLIT